MLYLCSMVLCVVFRVITCISWLNRVVKDNKNTGLISYLPPKTRTRCSYRTVSIVIGIMRLRMYSYVLKCNNLFYLFESKLNFDAIYTYSIRLFSLLIPSHNTYNIVKLMIGTWNSFHWTLIFYWYILCGILNSWN